MGNTFTAKTGYQPGDPEAWQAATDYALDAAKQQGWGAWYGARKQGITGFQGITRGSPGASVDPGFSRGSGARPRTPGSTGAMRRRTTTGRRPSARRAGRQTRPVGAPGLRRTPPGWPAPRRSCLGRSRSRGGPVRCGPRDVRAALQKQATAPSWALSHLGSKDFYNLCQRFIEQAYGTGGQYGSAAAAGKALFKTADPAQADVGDLVFFRPDASNGYAGHAAIYLGNGEMVGATNAGVTKDNLLTNPYWKNLLVGFGDPPGAVAGPRRLRYPGGEGGAEF